MRMHQISMAVVLSITTLHAAPIKLDKMVVTATKNLKSIDRVSSSVIVITSDEIKKSNAITLKDLLRKFPSINIQKGGFPVASSATKNTISIRGAGSSGTLFLIDGQRLAGEVKNPYDLNRIALSQIERIEIIKGPASSLYGSDAYGGLINIITKNPNEKLSANVGINTDFTLEGGGKSGEFFAGAGQKIDKFSYRFDISAMEQKGKIKNVKADVKKLMTPIGRVDAKESLNEDVSLYNLSAKLGYNINENITLKGGITYLSEDNEGFYVSAFHPGNILMNTPMGKKKGPFFNVPSSSTDRNRRINTNIALKANLSDNLILNGKIYHSQYKKRNETTSLIYKQMGYDSQSASMIDPMKANVNITSYEAYLQHFSDKNVLNFGSEYRDEKRDATVFTQENIFSTKKVDYTSVYLQDEYQFNDKLGFILGARYDKISDNSSKTTFKVGANYSYTNFLNFRINYAQGYRTPDIRELYISKMTPVGLQLGAEVIRGPKKSTYDLKAESIDTYETGVSGEYNIFNYDIAVFYNTLKDKIAQTKINNYVTFQNISEAYVYGIEVSLGLKLDRLKANFQFNALESEDKNTKKSLFYTPENSAASTLQYNIYDKIWLGASYNYTGIQYYKENNFRKKANGFGTLDLFANYEDDNLRLYLGTSNITDEDGNKNVYQSKGASIYSGISYSF